MRRASSIGVLALVSATLVSAGSARAQQTVVDAASPINPAETVCLNQSIGSACDSSSTSAGGTCQAGCCCHYVTDPEGAQYCAACLACSDTSNVNPAFSPGACSDGGTLVPDSGVFLYDAGMPPAGPTSSPTNDTATSSCACSNAGTRGGASSIQTELALLALGALMAIVRVRSLKDRR